jgi:TolB-like protein/Tfp pilus assembly protein PilF
MAALVLVAGLAGIPFLILPRFWSTRISSLAVMPFESLSSVPAQNYLGDAMTDQLIATFSRIRSLRVVSQKSVMRYKGGHRKLSDIAADLNVDAILVGSATDAGERVQINVRLIRFPGERALWSKSFDRSSGDVLMLQAELVLNIAAEIGRLFTPAEEKRLTGSAHAVDPELHALYLQGRLFASEPGRESIERGIRTLETVLAKEPGHAAAWVALAEGWFSLSSVYLNPRQAMPYAKAAARKAIALDPESDAGHAMLGRIHVTYDWDWQAGEDQLQKAIELNPNSSSAWRGLAFLRMAQGRSDESLQTIRRALALDPMSIWTHFQCAVILACMRRNDEAIRQARRALEWEPEFGFMRGMLGLIHGQKGEFAEAIRQLERSVQSIKVPTTLANLVLGYAQAGRQADAERIMSELLATADRQYVCPFEVAAAFAAMGRKEEAFQWMNKSIADRADCMIWLREEPWLDLIRSDPRYSELVRQVGLP